MALVPELDCMDPESYRKFFRALCWTGTKKLDPKKTKKGGKNKGKKCKATSAVVACHAPSLLGNPSSFVVYATVRRSILARWKHLHITPDLSDDSDSDDASSNVPLAKLPKITGIGLRSVFALISRARLKDPELCQHALQALLDVLQGHTPEELALEPAEVISNIHAMLVGVSGGGPGSARNAADSLTALACSCLIALTVARGETELILDAVTALIIAATNLSVETIKIPQNLTMLQRSVHLNILGLPSRNHWLNHGVPQQSLVSSFPVDLQPEITAGAEDLVVRSLVSDGFYLYIFSSRGLLIFGSGYSSSLKRYPYAYKPEFFVSDRHGWMGYCADKLYVRLGRKKLEIFEVDKRSFEVTRVIWLEPGLPARIEPKCAVFSDGHQLGLILLTQPDTLTIKLFDVESALEESAGTSHVSVSSHKELHVNLLRRRTLAIGRASFEDGLVRRSSELEAPVAVQFDDNDDDPLVGIYAGQDFALLITNSGKVYFTGKGASVGYKTATSHPGKWTLMKETIFNRNDTPANKKCKVIQVAVGHEGVHAVLVLDSGTALFTGVARRGEDGDSSKHRRNPKATRPKKISKAEGHYIVYAACNYGSTALVTRQGLLLMFGKDTQHCDTTGLVTGLRHERVTQVALGKAHAVVLTSSGSVYTFGINNKGQCGREFGYTKEKGYGSRQPSASASSKEELPICPSTHKWSTHYCRVCTLCRECTGFSSCHCATLPNRVPGEMCGCGQGDAGCSACGVCRRCADAFDNARADRVAQSNECDDDVDGSVKSEPRNEKENVRYPNYEGHTSLSETDREASVKVSCLPPARVAVPGGHRAIAVACGLHHTVLLLEHGEVLAFGSNQYGQIGAGDIAVHHKIVRVRVPRASAVACGGNHTAVLTKDGELYTFGSYQKGSLGRPRMEEPSPARSDRTPVWYATPGRVPRIGPRHACKAVWVSASGDQTFVQVSQSLIKTDTLFSSTITANANSIVILPNRPEHTFKCITINKSDGSCNSWTGPEQVDFVNTLACLDPLYDVLWCYQPQMRLMKCYNILRFDSRQLQKCCGNADTDAFSEAAFEYPNYGSMKRLEDFKNLENIDLGRVVDEKKPIDNFVMTDMSILSEELAIPCVPGSSVTRMHAGMHLLACLDSLTYAYQQRVNLGELKRDSASCAPNKEDFLTVNRFESHGGGWGYSGHSIEAIRFMCDSDILFGGIGLFGGRGEYTAKIKLFDIGPEGGDQEGDGELIAESDEITYECAPRDRYPVLFDSSIPLSANRWYVAWACVNGPSSDCGSSGQPMVISDDIGFHFKTSKKSNNGTDVNAGQIPCLLYNTVTSDQNLPNNSTESTESIVVLSKNISRKVTVACFKSLTTLIKWSWTEFKNIMSETHGQEFSMYRLTFMNVQTRLVYIVRACLRLIKCYINEVYPQGSKKRNSCDYRAYFEAISDARTLIQDILSDPVPTCAVFTRKPGKKAQRVCYVQFGLDLTNSVLEEAHETITSSFHAFFPTPVLKWNHLSALLLNVREGSVPQNEICELTATVAALCASRNLRDVLQYIVPLTQCSITINDTRRTETRVIKDVPAGRSATVPRSSHGQKPPPVPPRAHHRDQKMSDTSEIRPIHTEWNLLDVLPKLLDIVMVPMKEQMMTRPCGQHHDHGEAKQHRKLSEYSCKLMARIVAELSYSAANIKEEPDTNVVKQHVTPSRFLRVNHARSWNTGNGSPDAVCFLVDRPGVVLVGVCVYGGLGSYEYSLELLHDVRLRGATSEEKNPAHCWVSVDITHGAFSAADCQHDVVQINFDKPIPLKEETLYAIRLCNHGGRTANGDCGLPSVRGPDGTMFRFASCSLSYNGTTLARGQIPSLIYYSKSKSLTNTKERADSLLATLRGVAMRVASIIIERTADLFSTLRNELTAEDLRRNASVLQQSPAVNILIPYTLANLEGLEDAKSVVKLLDLIHKLLPHVAAMNLLVPSTEELSTTTTKYYTWVESDHPYKQATVSNMRVLFPSSVSWILLDMDPRSVTAQPEDSLTVYATIAAPKHNCHCPNDGRPSNQPFRKRLVQLTTESGDVEDLLDETTDGAPCVQYNCTYVSVTPKLANVPTEWPQKALLVPGNEVVFSLETASDYLNEFNKSNNEDNSFGYRCLCVGYEDAPFTAQKQGLLSLEMELIHAGAACASRLLTPDLDIPPVAYSTIVEVQLPTPESSPVGEDEEESRDGSEALLLSRGLELPSPPSVHHVLEGLPLLRCVSTERQFLSDFVAGAESTAGGRLACWLGPTSRVEPAKCELRPPLTPPRPNISVTLPVIIRDQYGEHVTSSALRVEVVVQRLEGRVSQQGRLSHASLIPNEPYHPTLVKDTMCFTAITVMKTYQKYSFEELRFASGCWGENRMNGSGSGGGDGASSGRVPAERLAVRAQPDGSYVASWTPKTPGVYLVQCVLDEQPAAQDLTIEVVETAAEGQPERATPSGSRTKPVSKVCLFTGTQSAGLRVRASPSLQAEELGRVPRNSHIDYIEKVVNKDGTWVRLGSVSVREYTDGGAGVAWCLQHHRHEDRELLSLLDASERPQSVNDTNEQAVVAWKDPERSDDVDTGPTDSSLGEGSKTAVADSAADLASDSDDSSGPPRLRFVPMKRTGSFDPDSPLSDKIDKAPNHVDSSNGNSDEEWWAPDQYNSNDNLLEAIRVLETDIEPEAESRSGSRLAQAGTQTSPESTGEEAAEGAPHKPTSVKKSRMTMKTAVRKLIASQPRPFKRTRSPPLPARTAPAPPPPRKHALSPAQAECVRAIFAALLWHEGIVHDAIACAAFLKFHPQLPKHGTRVITRAMHDNVPHHQRHSVEVTNTGQYLRIQPSTLQTLTRQGEEASTSRARKTDLDLPINEEDGLAHPHESGSHAVVNVLPPALRALVALWDTLYDADQFSAATDNMKLDSSEDNENEETRQYSCGSGVRKKLDWKAHRAMNKIPYTVFCELCGGKGALPPLAAHMRFVHAGCRTPVRIGYDRAGVYRPVDHAPEHDQSTLFCGQMLQEVYQIWYIFCEKCREKALKAAAVKPKATAADYGYEREPVDLQPDVDHHTMKENAMFLLDLAPLTNSERLRASPWDESSESPLPPMPPPGSQWQPAPPFQCMSALGAAPKATVVVDAARYHSLGRPMPGPLASNLPPLDADPNVPQGPRMHRSVSMGQASAREFPRSDQPMATDMHPDAEDIGAGSSLLAQPSAALQRLVSGGHARAVSAFEPPTCDPVALLNSPVLQFVLARRDLHTARHKMDALVRINTVRQYAFEALNWLLRSATQCSCVHDVMWWFCAALDKYARTIPPPIAIHDAKEGERAAEASRVPVPTASASSMCPGGRAARGARAAFHALLGAVSALATSLPPASPASLQAVRCWALHYSSHDRAFLHRSQVFSVISKILSHSEDSAHDDNAAGLHESVHSYLNKENYVWSCPDVTSWCDVAVSSRQGMAGALTDGSTETFWESGDEDRNKSKWFQVTFPGGASDDRPHIVCVHVDNTRDTVNKTVMASFLYSGASNELFHMQDMEVDSKAVTWLCYTLPRVSPTAVRVRCELRGPEAAVRVRQLRVLSVPAPLSSAASTPAAILHAISEADTLRVFRLLTSQVFGKLLDWDRSGSDTNGEGSSTVDDNVGTDDSDLREHVVGILFAGNKLTSLQRQVMSHIVCAIGCEAARVRDDWETALVTAELVPDEDFPPRPSHTQDNYCFEMLSLLLALSGSPVGRAHLAHRTELLADLLSLLHTGSERVQRQVISLLRRMIMEVPPQKMLAAINFGSEASERVSLLEHLSCYLAKAITVQMKVKGGGGSVDRLTMGSSVKPSPPALWFMRGETTKKHAQLIAKLLSDMAEGKVSPEWSQETRATLASYATEPAQMSEENRRPARCVASPTMWKALSALCVCEESHLDLVNNGVGGRGARGGRDAGRGSTHPFCANHDDGTTLAIIECRSCGPLCAECDRFLHLKKSARGHSRQICKEEESAIRIDIHEGCGRAKLFWLLLLVDRRTLKALAEFRALDTRVGDSPDGGPGSPGLSGVCRFCGARGSTGLLAIGNVCADQQCLEHGRVACSRVLRCGHACGGVRDERSCLPCLFGCDSGDGVGDEAAAAQAPLRQDADDMCMICFTDPLQAAPAIQLKCGHVFHLHCCKKVLESKWSGPRITFSFAQCPICKNDMEHWSLDAQLSAIRNLRDEVRRKALMRLEYEGVVVPGTGATVGSVKQPCNAAVYAMERYAYYVCHKCGKAYFGGLARCEAESSGSWEPEELVCGACSDVTGAHICPKHGADFLEYKCRYCCSVAVFFCFGTSHFCNACHDDFQRVTNIPKQTLPQCPAGPKGEQLPGTADECPLHVVHPPTGEEFALGCGVCRHANAF